MKSGAQDSTQPKPDQQFYIECSLPAGVTVAEYRRLRAIETRRRRLFRRPRAAERAV